MKNIYLMVVILITLFSCKRPGTSGLKVVGGKDDTAPSWYASIVVTKAGRDEIFCGGSLIADKTVLTAAHCVRDLGSPISVVLGKSDRTQISEQDKKAVKAIYVHENYESFNKGYDLALIYLENSVSNSTIDVAAAEGATDFKMYGFGKSSNFANLLFNNIQSLDLKKLDTNACSRKHAQNGVRLEEGSFNCFAGMNDGQDVCGGDSGSAVVADKDGSKFLHSVVSFGAAICTNKDSPTVFTKLSFFKDWVENHKTYEKFAAAQKNDWAGYYKKIRSLCYYGRSYNPATNLNEENYWDKLTNINLPQAWKPVENVTNYKPSTRWSLCEKADARAMNVVFGSSSQKSLFEVTSPGLGNSKKYLAAIVSEKVDINCKLNNELIEIEVDSKNDYGQMSFQGMKHALSKIEGQCGGSSLSCKVGAKEVKIFGNSQYLTCVSLNDGVSVRNYQMQLAYYGISVEISHSKQGENFKGEIRVRNDWKAPIRAWQLDCNIDGASYKLKEDGSEVRVVESSILDFSRFEYKGYDFPNATSKVITFDSKSDLSNTIARRAKCSLNGLKVPTTYRAADQQAADIYFGSRCCSRN